VYRYPCDMGPSRSLHLLGYEDATSSELSQRFIECRHRPPVRRHHSYADAMEA
jgi:hypothetical protein